MGTLKYYTDGDGNDVELSEHEGWVEHELVAEYVRVDSKGPFTWSSYDETTGTHWTTTYGGEMPDYSGRYRPGCECGWRGEIFNANTSNRWREEIFTNGKPDVLPDHIYDEVLEGWHTHVKAIIATTLDLDPIGQADRDVRNAQARLRRAVAAARTAGRSWSEIGGQLRVSKQAAWERFQDLDQ